jgi:hypothetical protein
VSPFAKGLGFGATNPPSTAASSPFGARNGQALVCESSCYRYRVYISLT